MGLVGRNANFVFVEHRGHHGGMARKERGSVRRHIANETLRKRCARHEPPASPAFSEAMVMQKVSPKDSDIDTEMTEKATSDKAQETRTPLDRLGVLSLPIGKPDDSELIDHISTRLWPGFRYNFEGSVNPFPKYWLPRSLENPALYHAFVFSARCHLSSRLSLAGQKPRDKGKLVSLETRALVATRDQINCHNMTTSANTLEDLIMITICLATNVQGESLLMARDPSPFYPILTSGRWLDTYGALACRNVHWNAVLQLVEKCGGIEKISSFGLPWVITCAALNVASTTLSPPAYPLLDVKGRPCQMKKYKELVNFNLCEPACLTMGGGFEILKNVGLSDNLVNAFTSLGDFSMALDAYSTGQMTNVDMDAMLDTRDVVIHTLLSLPSDYDAPTMQSRAGFTTLPGSSAEADISLFIYQACRWAALLYVIMLPCVSGSGFW
ncbi:hypothetical protein N7510_000118 [Penicillium lagena]|uniref:uncharacterized protein n=1 Tax=Penicillium lagena TaxID=94218 RepID=UPI00253FCA54|nr:uncharacterized protein N7510_000118 [Penicillium lagena]KAJ5623809.1 hypothetical protein N7510_000118 [Penicillium lagena]